MKLVPEKLRPWLIAAWFLTLYAWNLYFAWSAAPAPSTGDDYRRILLDALWQFTTPFHIFLTAIVIGAMFINWEW
jgi:hypothetical protein